VRRIAKVWPQVARTVRPVAATVAALAFVAGPPAASARQSTPRTPTPSISTQSKGPLLLVVSIRNQKLHVYDVDGEIASSRVSTGRAGFATPTGVFSILEKNVRHQSNIYSGAEMPYMQRITWSGIALHAGVVPGFRASHGCIRLPYSFSKRLYDITKLGSRVIVTGDDAEPVAFNHPKLFRPLPFDDASTMRLGPPKEPQLAMNERADDGTASDAARAMPRFIGISPALIRAVAEMPRDPQRRPATRVEADQMIQEKIKRLQAALKAADSARVAATAKAKTAVKNFDAANDRMSAARSDIEPIRAAVKAAEKKQQDAINAFEDYMSGATSRTATKSTSKADGKSDDAGNREAELEAAVLNLTNETDKARAEAAKSEMSLAVVQTSFSAAQSARDTALESVRQAQFDLQSAKTSLIDTNKEVVRRAKPISVLISLKAQRIYIRQGVEPILEAPITVAPLPGRIGTHVFTAMRYGSDPNTLEWQLVSAQTPTPGQALDQESGKWKRGRDLPSSRGFNVQMATAALDAFTIPDDILATITEFARPGASLIVSDRELPLNENGSGTEFVVLTR
jgi:predicted  nucleic acid-binding Zn-ribbon protein